MRSLCSVLLIVGLLGAFAAHADPTTLTGTITKVRDGDTIEVGKVPIRLSGVSAPEMNEPLGPQSKAFMTDLVMGKRVRCELDVFKRLDHKAALKFLKKTINVT